ncbi:MAG TPA: hypothetical protein VL095_06695 [Flavisolibacter sp.]|nr:hypothetical protein [Flavisolibacter sp.]
MSKGSFYSDKTPVTAQSKFVFAIIGDFAYVKANGKLMKLKWLTGMGDDDKGADGYKSGRYTANFKYNSGNYSLEIMDNEKENAKTVADTIVFEGALYKAEAD